MFTLTLLGTTVGQNPETEQESSLLDKVQETVGQAAQKAADGLAEAGDSLKKQAAKVLAEAQKPGGVLSKAEDAVADISAAFRKQLNKTSKTAEKWGFWNRVQKVKEMFTKSKPTELQPTNETFDSLEKSDALRVRVDRVVLQDIASSPLIDDPHYDWLEQSQYSKNPTAVGPTYRELKLPIHLSHGEKSFPPRQHSVDIQMTALPGTGMKWFIRWMGHIHELSPTGHLSESGLSQVAHPTDPSKACRWKDTPDGMILESVSAKFQENHEVTFDITWDWEHGQSPPQSWGESSLSVWVQRDDVVSNEVILIEKNAVLPKHRSSTVPQNQFKPGLEESHLVVGDSEPYEIRELGFGSCVFFAAFGIVIGLVFIYFRLRRQSKQSAHIYDRLENNQTVDPTSEKFRLVGTEECDFE